MLRRNKILLAVGVLVIALIALRLALPSIVKDYVNDTLQALESYDGSVEDIDLHLWRGAYRVDGLRIVKTGSDQPTPFFSSDHIDFSIEWRNLLHGSLVAEGVFDRPDLNLVQAKSEEESQLGKEVNWAEQLGELFPFRFNTVRVRDGRITFRAPGIRTQDALTAEHVNAELLNLTNVIESGEETFAEFSVTGRVLGDAPIGVKGRLDPLAEQPTFDVNLDLENVQLPKVNPWLREFIKADAEGGDFQLYLEIAAAEGKFKGYAKPVMQNVNIYSSEEPEENPLRRLWEGVVEFAANVFENQEEDQVAARVPFSGTIQNPESSIFETIVSVLRNAFVSAFARSLEGSISLRDVKGNLEGIGDDGKKEANGDRKKEDKDASSRRDR
ncbi:MAG: DUF748 domain-containing protein [Steroidobacter sp.]